MDKILVADLPVRARVGETEEERAGEQELRIDIELVLDLGPAGVSDQLDDSRDYERACRVVTDILASRPFHLIEAVAETAAEALLREIDVDEVGLVVRKPGALKAWGARHAAVEIRRRRHA